MMRATLLALVMLLTACATPDKPVRPSLYDFGAGIIAPSAQPAQHALAPLVFADIAASGALDGSMVLYRLAYADAHQLRPYALARWSAPAPHLVHQRLRQMLARDRAVLDLSESAALARTSGAMPKVLRMDLEEFSHWFESPGESWGVLRLRVTVMEKTPAGEKLLAQRSVVIRQRAATPDVSGAVRALAEATDAAALDIGQWLRQLP